MSTTTRPTVLIHGFGFDHRIWYPVELAFEGHHVIYLSLPGFGMDKITEPYTIADLANKYWRHLNDVVKEPVHLVGHSMGGYVCMEMLAQQPSRVASLVLVHSHVFEDPAEKKEGRTAAMNDINENGREAFVKKMIPSLFATQSGFEKIIEMLIERGMLYDDHAWCFGTRAMRDRTDHAATLRKAEIPVMMIMGEKDKAVPVELANKQAPLSQQASLKLYPEVGHMAMYEHPSHMIGDLIRFYEGQQA